MVSMSDDPEKVTVGNKFRICLIQKRFVDDLFFANVPGRRKVICFAIWQVI